MAGNNDTCCLVVMVIIFAFVAYYLFFMNKNNTVSIEKYSNEDNVSSEQDLNSEPRVNDTSDLLSVEPDSDDVSDCMSSSTDESIETIRNRAKGRNNIRVNAYRQQRQANDLESVAKHFEVHDVTQQEQEPTPLIEQDGEHAMVDINNNKGSERDKFKLENFLPVDDKSKDWFETIDTVNVKNKHLINIYRPCGVNTTNSSHKNVTLDIRGEPTCPKDVVAPWYQSSIEPNIKLKNTEFLV